ncbi:MAG: hypothetical protein AAGI23_14855 [Bacteroidota bacterium]
MQLSPKQLFLLDGMGALTSACLLGVVLVQLESYFGIPKRVLHILAAVPCLFVIYDGICYFGVRQHASWLRYIAVANMLYCLLSFYCTVIHLEQLTALGHVYLLSEIAIVLFLARLEWQASC